jgi:anti-anti-sigma factor
MNELSKPRLRLTHQDGTYMLDGELDRVSASHLEAQLADNEGPIRLDVRAVTFLDSYGIHALVRLRQRCQANGCDLHLEDCSPAVERVLRIVDLYEELTANSHAGDISP